MIKVACPSCHKTINAPEKYAGRQVNCPGCKSPLSIPSIQADDFIEDDQEDPKPSRTKRPNKKSASMAKRKGPRRSKRESDSEERPRRKNKHHRREATPSKNNLVIALVALVLCVGIGAGLYFAFFNQENKIREESIQVSQKNESNKENSIAHYIPDNLSGYGSLNFKKLSEIPAFKEAALHDEARDIENLKRDFNDSKEAKSIIEELESSNSLEVFNNKIKNISFVIDTSKITLHSRKPELAFLIESKVDAQKEAQRVHKAFKNPLKVIQLAGHDAYEVDKGELYIVPLSKDLLVFGSKDMIIRIKESKDKGNVSNPAYTNHRVKNHDQIFWMSWKNQGEKFVDDSIGLPFNPNDLKSIFLSFNYSSKQGLKVSSSLGFPSSNQSKGIANFAKANLFKFLSQFSLTDQHISISSKGKNALLEVNLSEKKLNSIISMAKATSSEPSISIEPESSEESTAEVTEGNPFLAQLAAGPSGTLAFIPKTTSGFMGFNIKKFSKLKAVRDWTQSKDHKNVLGMVKSSLRKNSAASMIMADMEATNIVDYFAERIKKITMIVDTSKLTPSQSKPEFLLLVETHKNAKSFMERLIQATRMPLSKSIFVGFEAYKVDRQDAYLVPISENMILLGSPNILKESINARKSRKTQNHDFRHMEANFGENVFWTYWIKNKESFVPESKGSTLSFNDPKVLTFFIDFDDRYGIELSSTISFPNKAQADHLKGLLESVAPNFKNQLSLQEKEFKIKQYGGQLAISLLLKTERIMPVFSKASQRGFNPMRLMQMK